MKKIISLIFFLSFSIGYCQNNNDALQSKIYLNKALWFQEMPHYNGDSCDYYFKKAAKKLQCNSKYYGNDLAVIYYHLSNYSNINNSYTSLDSLATVGWNYFEKSVKKNKNPQFEYDYLTNWSFIKLENSKTKDALKLFSKAIVIGNEFKNEDQKAKFIADKGTFYERYKLRNEQKLALTYMNTACRYFEKIGIEKKPVELYQLYRGLIGYYSDRNVDSLFHYSNKMQSLLKYSKKPQKHAWYYVTTARDIITYPLKGEKKISTAQYNKGKAYIIEALDILEKNKIYKNSIIPYAHGLLADLYINEKKYDLAIDSYKKSHLGYQLLNNKKSATDINMYIAKAYQQKGELNTSINYYKLYFNEAIQFEREINERSLRENELQVNLIEQNKENAIQKNKISQNKLIQILGLGIVTLLIGLLIFGYLSYLNRNRKNELLAIKNAENELLMKEIHHRVKNNLEIVSSLLALQSAQIDDSNTKEAIAVSQNRVNSIGIVHQKLYQGTNLGAVEMKDYFLNLSESILDSFGAEQRIDLQLSMENLDLDIDTAVPLGLIVNELLTNCVKYAFPKGEKGTIIIKLNKKNNILRLEVADNGVGKSGITHGTGFGGQLVSLLTQQLNGKMTEENQNGTKIVFDFKIKAA